MREMIITDQAAVISHLIVVAGIKGSKIELSHREGVPQAQVADSWSFVSRDRVVVGLSDDLRKEEEQMLCDH